MKPKNPVVWFEIYVNDIERARKFYEEVFQFEFAELGDPTEESFKMLAFPADMETKIGLAARWFRSRVWRQEGTARSFIFTVKTAVWKRLE